MIGSSQNDLSLSEVELLRCILYVIEIFFSELFSMVNAYPEGGRPPILGEKKIMKSGVAKKRITTASRNEIK